MGGMALHVTLRNKGGAQAFNSEELLFIYIGFERSEILFPSPPFNTVHNLVIRRRQTYLQCRFSRCTETCTDTRMRWCGQCRCLRSRMGCSRTRWFLFKAQPFASNTSEITIVCEWQSNRLRWLLNNYTIAPETPLLGGIVSPATTHFLGTGLADILI